MQTRPVNRRYAAVIAIICVGLLVALLVVVHTVREREQVQTRHVAGPKSHETSISPKPTREPTHAAEPAYPTTLPKDNLKGWRLVTSQDFDKDASLGSFERVYGTKLAGYNLIPDHNSKGTGIYDPARVLSVRDGVLSYNLHADGQHAYIAAPEPMGNSGQKYGRYIVRFRSDIVPGYRMSLLLWPADNSPDWWHGGGEIDMAEARLDTGRLNTYLHNTQGDPSENTAQVDWNTQVTAWHTMDLEWTPTRITATLDGKSYTTVREDAIPQHAMRWVLQTQTRLTNTLPDSDVSGNVQIDWFAQYAYMPAVN